MHGMGARYLDIKRNVEKVGGARYTSVRVIYRKIRYFKFMESLYLYMFRAC
jgi:hypothetical protein